MCWLATESYTHCFIPLLRLFLSCQIHLIQTHQYTSEARGKMLNEISIRCRWQPTLADRSAYSSSSFSFSIALDWDMPESICGNLDSGTQSREQCCISIAATFFSSNQSIAEEEREINHAVVSSFNTNDGNRSNNITLSNAPGGPPCMFIQIVCTE